MLFWPKEPTLESQGRGLNEMLGESMWSHVRLLNSQDGEIPGSVGTVKSWLSRLHFIALRGPILIRKAH